MTYPTGDAFCEPAGSTYVPARLRSSCALAAFSDFLDLPQMAQVVSREHADDVADGLLAALLMHAVVSPQVLRHSFEHGEIALSQHAEGFERSRRITPRIGKRVSPDILVKGLQGNAIVAQDKPHAPATDQFRIGQMG